ncbi:right-handed parallel beta-helix repeat-containing protein [Robertkochia sediminum]|uniref:right-handed parallel beta-helix repeat-containing protein n=1 Tax=Robertkochia sediminum TaxID=2785326 RepID=UPI00193172A4|nr:right-handed parallel beta-helix repeat-containing protein [Robertkochia sediminum]MBL7473602.1 hypothetical protein [Robertkochia sediminum]
MLKNLLAICSLLTVVLLGSCREDLEYRPSADTLRFSRDTVFLDTVFNGLSSSTYNLKVYNTGNDDISIPEVFLELRNNSNFRLNVNGEPGKEFSHVEIPAKDSIYIFIESTVALNAPATGSFLATDAIIFTDGNSREEVALVTLIQDAVFLYPARNNGVVETIAIGIDEDGNELRTEGFELQDDQLNFTSQLPYVIYGYAAVPSGKTLEIEAGTRVHFHEASGILVKDGGSLQVNGAPSTDMEIMENEVIFEGDRLEPEFSDIPGQWGTIWMAEGSINNRIDHLTIKNATIGIITEGNAEATPSKLNMTNSRVLNSANINIFARNTSLDLTNCIAGSAGQPSVYLTRGGRYKFEHCTIANYWNTGLRSFPALLIDNFEFTNNESIIAYPLTAAVFNNCIITGNASVEFLLNRSPEAEFNFNFNHSLLQFNTTSSELVNNPLYDLDDPALYSNNIINGNPGFVNPADNDYSLLAESDAIDLGDPLLLPSVPTDILGDPRGSIPDAGAYEYKEN